MWEILPQTQLETETPPPETDPGEPPQGMTFFPCKGEIAHKLNEDVESESFRMEASQVVSGAEASVLSHAQAMLQLHNFKSGIADTHAFSALSDVPGGQDLCFDDCLIKSFLRPPRQHKREGCPHNGMGLAW